MNTYEAKQAARKASLENRAERLREAANRYYNEAKAMGSIIPFGQPILIGHHSESRDRNYRARIGVKYEKAFRLMQQAEKMAERATTQSNNISGDDPDAAQKLQAKIDALEAQQKHMVKVNALIRKSDDAGLSAMGYSDSEIVRLKTPDCCGRIGYPSFQLTNNNANIRRLKERLELQQKTAELETQEKEYSFGRLRRDMDENRYMFFFDGKPDENTRTTLKRNGFKWSPSRGAWVRQITPNAAWAIKDIVAALSKPATSDGSSTP